MVSKRWREMETIKVAASSVSVFVPEPKLRCVTSFISHLSLRWWVPSVTLLMTASKLCCVSAHCPPVKHPRRGFLHREARGEGGEGESLALRDRSPTADAFVSRLLMLWNVVEPGGLWPDLYSEGTGGQRGWNKKKRKEKGTGKLGSKKGSEWRKGRLWGWVGGGWAAWNKVFRNRSTSISFFLLSL